MRELISQGRPAPSLATTIIPLPTAVCRCRSSGGTHPTLTPRAGREALFLGIPVFLLHALQCPVVRCTSCTAYDARATIACTLAAESTATCSSRLSAGAEARCLAR